MFLDSGGIVQRPKLNFQDIAIEDVLSIAERERVLRQSRRCSICGAPVELERCKIDENGDAVHDDCYLLKASRNQTAAGNSAQL